MIEVEWIKTAERLPTGNDGRAGERVLASFNSLVVVRDWFFVAENPNLYSHWARIPEFAPPKVPRKLAPEWRELRADSWSGSKAVWLFHISNGYKIVDSGAFAGHFATLEYTHWQPVAEPRVYEDESK
jgi:hypothetical protein